jgi:hypothetical protein
VLEAIMAGFVAPVIAMILGLVVVAVFAVNAVVVRREDRHYSLIGVAPDGLSRRMRQLNGAHSRARI